jgi:hypothetical protein
MMRRFVLLVAPRPADDQLREMLRRCPDAAPADDRACRAPSAGGFPISFARRAPSLIDAIVTAVRDLDVVGLTAVYALDHGFLVSLAEVARRTGHTRREIARLIRTASRTRPFPAAARSGPDGDEYPWPEVAEWLRTEAGLAIESSSPEITAVNLALQLRAMSPVVERIAALRALVAG